MLTNGGEARVLGENSPLALALPKALGRAIVSESETRSDCIKSSLVVIISVTYAADAEVAQQHGPTWPLRGTEGGGHRWLACGRADQAQQPVGQSASKYHWWP